MIKWWYVCKCIYHVVWVYLLWYMLVCVCLLYIWKISPFIYTFVCLCVLEFVKMIEYLSVCVFFVFSVYLFKKCVFLCFILPIRSRLPSHVYMFLCVNTLYMCVCVFYLQSVCMYVFACVYKCVCVCLWNVSMSVYKCGVFVYLCVCKYL